MKKIFTIIVVLFMLISSQLVFTSAKIDEGEDFFDNSTNQIDYDLTPLIELIEIDGVDREVYFTKNEGYYYDGECKVVLVEMEDTDYIELNAVQSRSATMKQFMNDFYYTSSYVPKNIKLSATVKWTLDLVKKKIANKVLTYLGASEKLSSLVIDVAEFAAALIIDNPPEYLIKMNIRYYKHKVAGWYLTGETYNLIVDDEISPTQYHYIWSENPQLGIIDPSVKMVSLTYPYKEGIGQ